MSDDLKPCHDCGAAVGQPHEVGCDTARCLWTGGQRLACEMGMDFIEDPEEASDAVLITSGPPREHECGKDIWTGLWPGDMECREFGWYAYFVPNGNPCWVPCEPDHPDAVEDLNRLYREARWDREQARFVLR